MHSHACTVLWVTSLCLLTFHMYLWVASLFCGLAYSVLSSHMHLQNAIDYLPLLINHMKFSILWVTSLCLFALQLIISAGKALLQRHCYYRNCDIQNILKRKKSRISRNSSSKAGLPKLTFCMDPLVKRKIKLSPLMSNNKLE